MYLGVLCILLAGHSQAALDSDQSSLLQTKSRRDIGNKVGSGTETEVQILENVPYIIRQWSKSYNKAWYGASMSYTWEGVPTNGHPMAALWQDTEYLWYFRKNGKHWSIKAYSGSRKGWGLSWDSPQKDGDLWYCKPEEESSCYPLVSLEEGKETPWEIELVSEADEPKRYAIKNAYWGDKYYNQFHDFALSWDGVGYDNPRVSAQNRSQEKCDWEIIPALQVKGFWAYKGDLPPSSAVSKTITWTEGVEKTTELSKSSSFSETLEVTMSAGVELEIFSFGAEETLGMTKEETRAVTEAVALSHSKEISVSHVAGDLEAVYWTFVAEIRRNHLKFKKNGVWTSSADDEFGLTTVGTDSVAYTPDKDTDPKCFPGTCKVDSGCQRCTNREGCISEQFCDLRQCASDKHSSCAKFKLQNMCDSTDAALATERIWMRENCDTTCHCS